MKLEFPSFFKPHTRNYLWLLLSLFNLLLSPITVAFFPSCATLIISINFSLIIITAIQTGTRNRRRFATGLVLGALSLLGIWLELTINWSSELRFFRAIITIIFFCYITFTTFHWLVVNKSITLNTIFAAIAGFLLLGFVGGVLSELLNIYLPNSLNVPEGASTYHYFYFSFVTMISLGYGDIVPLNEPAQSLSLFLAIVGQFYFTILVAILVGKYLSSGKSKKKKS